MNKNIITESSITEKIAAGVSAIVIAAFILVLSLNLKIAPNYNDFIVGNITWQADTKIQDLIAIPIFILVLFSVFIFLSLQLDKLKKQFGIDYSIKLSNQLILWSAPCFAGICNLILGTNIDKTLMVISVLSISFVAIVSTYNASKSININPELTGLIIFSIILMGLIPLEIALALGRMPMNLVGVIDLNRYKTATYIIIGFGMVIGLFYAIRHPEKLLKFFPKFILLGQIGLPTFFLTLYPARFLQPDGVFVKYQTTWGLRILLIGMTIVGIFDVVRRYRKYTINAELNLVNLISPVALFALLVALQVGNTVSPHISPDDYHFGEKLLGLWSYLQGEIPYVGYLPAHGIIPDDLSAFISFIFYDGSAGGLLDAGRLGYALLAFFTFISIYRFSGSLGLAFILTFFAGRIIEILFFTPFICLWFSHPLRTNPARWLSVWMLTVPIVILGVPGQGLLLVAASGVMTAYFAWRLWRNPEERVWRDILISLVILIFLGLATPFIPMLFGAIRYVLENGPINQLAYGIPWAVSWTMGEKKGFIFELIRMSWVVIPLVCLTVIYVNMKNEGVRKNVLFPAFVVLIFVFLLIPYSMGRIDPGGLSRPGYAAIFGWSTLLPLAVWGILKPLYRVPLILVVTAMCATFNLTVLSFPSLVSTASANINTGPLRDGLSAGLSNIGRVSAEDDHWDRLIRLNALLNRKLSPGEGYLDLTSRNAQYFYFDRKPMMVVTAPYNMVSSSQQKREIERLSKNLPRLVILDAANIIHDGGGLALRNPHLYRFIIDNYLPSFQDGFIIGERIIKKDISSRPMIEVNIKNFTDINWDRGIHRFESFVAIDNPVLFPFIKIGNEVQIGNSEPRKILNINIKDNSLIIEGGSINRKSNDFFSTIQIAVTPQVEFDYKAALFQKAFSTSDFRKIPVSWGKSSKSLENRMTLVKSLNEIPPILNQVSRADESYKVNGVDPYLIFDISSAGLSGHDAGFLKFDFLCHGRNGEPRVQIFWWGDDHKGPSESFSIKFTAENGTLIIPLDASPLWLTLKRINGIRIDLDNPASCSTFDIKNSGLFQRIF